MHYFLTFILLLLLSLQYCNAKSSLGNSPILIQETDSLHPFDETYMAQYPFLSQEEKAVFYYLNYARQHPHLFAEQYVRHYVLPPNYIKEYAFDERKASLIELLTTMEPVPALVYDENLYRLAHCFAYTSGILGTQGHDRRPTGCRKEDDGECCQYGFDTGLRIVMAFLIDAGYNNVKLKHRQTCLDASYTKIGVSIQPHKRYKVNAVVDFGY